MTAGPAALTGPSSASNMFGPPMHTAFSNYGQTTANTSNTFQQQQQQQPQQPQQQQQQPNQIAGQMNPTGAMFCAMIKQHDNTINHVIFITSSCTDLRFFFVFGCLIVIEQLLMQVVNRILVKHSNSSNRSNHRHLGVECS
jgi:hypothetical protein